MSWIAQVNAEHYAGYTDWRVPTAGELQSILLAPCPVASACIDPIFSPWNATDSGPAPYWSSSASNLLDALMVNFENGILGPLAKDSQLMVRAVR